MDLNKKEKITEFFVLAVFGLLTFYFLFQRVPFWDEAHAWMISKTFGFFELFKIEKFEGHLFLWHAILSPFSKNNFFYPYSMYIINWLFCMAALIVFWNKAPFSTLEKTLMTFSYPFALYFAPVARCYSIGLLFLFLILSIWNERLKHPVLISVLIFLLANTSVMALVGAFLLGLIFIFDLIKIGEIKKIIPSALIFLFTACLVLLQLNGASHYQEKEIFILFLGRIKTFLFWGFNGGITGILNQFISFVSVCFYVSFLAAAIKKPKALFFFILSNLFLVCIFTFKYLGNWWHYLFFYVYAIVSVWLLRLENIKFKNIFFISLIFLMSLKTVLFKFDNVPFLFDSKTDKIVEIIKEKELLKKDYKLYSLESDSNTAIGILPYFDGLKNYDVFGRERYTNKEFKAILYDYRTEIDPDILSKTFEFDKKNIAITDFKRKTKYYGKSFDLLLIPVYENKNPYFALYEMRLYKK